MARSERMNLRVSPETYELLSFIASQQPGMTATGFARSLIEGMQPQLQQLADAIRAMHSDQPQTALDKLNAMYLAHEHKGDQFAAQMQDWKAEVNGSEVDATSTDAGR